MNIVTLVEPPVEPVTVAEVYEFLRWDAEEFDGVPPEAIYPLENTIGRHIKTARIWVEQATRRALVMQQLRMTIGQLDKAWLTGFGRIGGWSSMRGIDLLRPPVATIDEVGYYDSNNTLQVLDPADYFLAEDYVPQLRFAYNWQTPCMYERPDAFRITYTAGYNWVDSPADYTVAIPAPLKDAICLQVQILADRFDVNEKADVMRTRDDLISSFRVHNF